MSELTVKDFLLFYLKVSYVERSQIVMKLMNHIEKIHGDFIISNLERNKHMKELSDIIKLLNTTYNSRLKIIRADNTIDDEESKTFLGNDDMDDASPKQEKIKLHKIDKDELDMLLSDFVDITPHHPDNNNSILQSLMSIINLTPNDKLSIICRTKFNYDEVDTRLCTFVSSNGADTLDDVFLAFINKKINYVFNEETPGYELVNILCETFRPISCVYTTTTDIKNKHIKVDMTQEQHSDYEILLNNHYKIKISFVHEKKYKIFDIDGYFIGDCLNTHIRTSQLCSQFIHNKKKLLVDATNGIKSKNNKLKTRLNVIPSTFKDAYIKNMTLGELLVLTTGDFITKLINDYELYQTYSISNNFKSLFGDFIKANLHTKFNIIRCLLMGPIVATNNAGLLYSLTKENKNGSPIVADIIYKNLNITSQLKLHKSNTYIKNEIEKFNNLDIDDIDLKKQIIMNNNIPPKVKKLAMEKLEEMKSGNSEYHKQLQYVKIIAEYPWIGANDEDIFYSGGDDLTKWHDIMVATQQKLDSQVYGHKDCKETIVEQLGKWFSNPNSLGKAIGLQGPPGVGKTMLAKGLGDALKMPFTQINLGGMEDGAVLTGHSITYSGAVPGLIIKKMVEAGKPRCIMFFDELDKACFRHGRNEIYDILIHVIDPNSNAEFNDKFFQDVRFPINKVLFIFSFNDREKIDRILLDRMEIIDVKAYTMEDKIVIAKDFLLKEVIADIGIKNPTIDISDEALGYIVESFTYEAGVRDLKRKIEKIILKLNKDRIYKSGIFAKAKVKSHCTITKEIVDKYLTKPNILVKKVHTTSEVGVVNGLYATTSGMGGIIPILVYKHHMGKHGKFILKLTGKQGVVMKESVFYAFTIATNLIKTQYCDKFFNAYQSGLHIHTPDGATSKDGPSAGGAFLLAFISKILNKRIKHNIGMTGEIEINGNITAIGGLEYKLDGAKRAGINLVFVPKENEHDIEKIKATNKTLFSETFKYQLVEHISQIADMALIEDNTDLSHDVTYEKTFDSSKYLELHASAEQIHVITDTRKTISDDSDEESENEESNEESSETESDTDSDMEYD